MLIALTIFAVIFTLLAVIERRRSGRRLRLDSQNLNELPGNRLGYRIRHGRAWLYVNKLTFHAEWHFLYWTSFKVGIDFGSNGGDDDILITLSSPLFSIYLGVGGLRYGYGWRRLPDGRECYISIHNATIWINPWSRDGEWRSKDPWWVQGIVIDLADLFLGKETHNERDVKTEEIAVPMPEGSYRGTARLFESTWSRPRWFARRLMRIEINVPGGIPFEGKGESAHDCGEDAVFGTTCQAKTVEEGIASMVEGVLRDRRRYGGSYLHGKLALAYAPQRQ